MAWPPRAPTLQVGDWTLRPLEHDDSVDLLTMFADQEVVRWLWARPLDGDSVSRFLEAHRRGWAERGAAELVVTRDRRPLALLRLHTFETGSSRIGWLSFPAGRGRGAVTAGLRILLEWARSELDIHTVHAHVDLDNGASLRVAVRAGFRDTGFRVPSIRPDGEPGLDAVFELS